MIKALTNKIARTYPQIKKRVFEVDFLRGLCILLMILDHFFYDWYVLMPEIFGTITGPAWLEALHDFAKFWWEWDVREVTRFIVVALFFFLSGISTSFSRSNIKRGSVYFTIGIFISCITFDIDQMTNGIQIAMIVNTIFTFGLATLLFGIFEYLFKKFVKNKLAFTITCASIGVAIIIAGYMSPTLFDKTATFQELNFSNLMLSILGYGRLYNQADYMPLFPYLGFIFLGAAFASIFYKEKKSLFQPLFDKFNHRKKDYVDNIVWLPSKVGKGVSFVGRYAFLTYIIHQGALIIICAIIMLSLGYSLNI